MKNSASNHGRKAGIGLVEVLIAVLVVSACAVPVVYMVTSARTDTTKAINYLRAMELANEVIEWASVARYSKVDAAYFSAFAGPLAEEEGADLKPVSIAVDDPTNTVWSSDGLTADSLAYSEQYNNAFFYREIEIENVSDSYIRPDLLKKVTVTVKWSEGHRPANINLPDDRTRQVQLSVLILNDENLSY